MVSIKKLAGSSSVIPSIPEIRGLETLLLFLCCESDVVITLFLKKYFELQSSWFQKRAC
jgi:hypothetical protein